jgi:hypothetical protein
LEEFITGFYLLPYACTPDDYVVIGKYAKSRYNQKYVPLRDFRHFSGNGKPWTAKNIDLNKTSTFDSVQNMDAQHYWYYILRQVDKELGMNLDFSKVLSVPESLFGFFPTGQMVAKVAKSRNTENHW